MLRPSLSHLIPRFSPGPVNNLWLNKYRLRGKEGYISKGVLLKDNLLKFYFSGKRVKLNFVGLKSRRSLGLNDILSTSQLSSQTGIPALVAAESAGFIRRLLSWAACSNPSSATKWGGATLV